MRFTNFRFCQTKGIEYNSWYSSSLNDWQKDKLDFIEFKKCFEFGQRHPEGLAPHFWFHLRIGNIKFKVHFFFDNLETVKPVYWGVSPIQKHLLRYWQNKNG